MGGDLGEDQAMSDNDEQWYWCMTHGTTEQGVKCRAQDRMGPYATEEAARNWKQTRDAREDKWEEQDDRWEGVED